MLWVADTGAGAIRRFDLATGRFTLAVTAPAPRNLAAGPDGAYVVTDLNQLLSRVEPTPGGGAADPTGPAGWRARDRRRAGCGLGHHRRPGRPYRPRSAPALAGGISLRWSRAPAQIRDPAERPAGRSETGSVLSRPLAGAPVAVLIGSNEARVGHGDRRWSQSGWKCPPTWSQFGRSRRPPPSRSPRTGALTWGLVRTARDSNPPPPDLESGSTSHPDRHQWRPGEWCRRQGRTV